MKGKIIVYQGKSYIIANRNVYKLYLETKIELYKSYTSLAHEGDIKHLIYMYVSLCQKEQN